MLDGWHEGELVVRATVIWRSRRKLAAGQINRSSFSMRGRSLGALARSLQHHGHGVHHECGGGVLGLSLPGCAAIPAPYRERGQIPLRNRAAHRRARYEDLRPSKILTRQSFLNAITLCCHWGFDECATTPGRHGAPCRHRETPRDWMEFGRGTFRCW